jgi:hypothetical protein
MFELPQFGHHRIAASAPRFANANGHRLLAVRSIDACDGSRCKSHYIGNCDFAIKQSADDVLQNAGDSSAV